MQRSKQTKHARLGMDIRSVYRTYFAAFSMETTERKTIWFNQSNTNGINAVQKSMNRINTLIKNYGILKDMYEKFHHHLSILTKQNHWNARRLPKISIYMGVYIFLKKHFMSNRKECEMNKESNSRIVKKASM